MSWRDEIDEIWTFHNPNGSHTRVAFRNGTYACSCGAFGPVGKEIPNLREAEPPNLWAACKITYPDVSIHQQIMDDVYANSPALKTRD